MSKNKFWYRLITAMVTLSLTIAIGGVAIAEEKVTIPIEAATGPLSKVTGEQLVATGNHRASYTVLINSIWNALHPEAKVTIKYTGSQANNRDFLMTALASGEGPAYYRLSPFPSLYDVVTDGLATDITKYVNDPQLKAEYFDHMSPMMKDYWKNSLWIKGHCYGLVGPIFATGIYYRKDWFKEAGVFNAQGVGAPPDHWTLKDFREIAKKITNPKKKRWGFILRGQPRSVGYCLMDRFGADEVIPDKSGKYTWRAGFTLPTMVDFMSFLHNMIFKDKSILTGTEFGWGENWHGFFDHHTGGMIADALPDGLVDGAQTNSPVFGKKYTDAAGLAPYPIGRGGIKELSTFGQRFLINPFLTDAQKKGTVEYLLYRMNDKGNVLYALLYNGYFLGEKKFPINSISYCGLPNAPWMKQWEFGLPSDYAHAWKLIMEEKTKPTFSSFGLFVKNFTAVHDALGAAYGMIISTPDANIEKELSKAANIANKSLNYKSKEITLEELKTYYTAIGKYYQETAPEFYKNTYLPLLEKYYKVW